MRNPSPPPELLENRELLEADTIHNTTYSKHWLFSTLMKLIQEVDKEEASNEESEFGLDVDEELQNELCKLWDMSMNTEVSNFLHEFKATEILAGVIGRSKAPRVTEISIGILGNMACVDNICVTMAKNSKLRDMVLLLLESSDPQTLNETTRFLYTSLSNTEARDEWINSMNGDVIRENIMFILKSSTNSDLLKNTGEFVDILLDVNEELCQSWGTIEFMHALLEAIKQIGCHHSEALKTYLHILQLFSTSETGVQALVDCSEDVEQPLMKYLGIICEDEIVGLENREACLASALSVLNIIFSACETTSNRMIKDEKLVRIFLKIVEPLYPWLQQLNKANGKAAESEATNEMCSASKSSNDNINQNNSSSNQASCSNSASSNQNHSDKETHQASSEDMSRSSESSSRLDDSEKESKEDEKTRQHLNLLYNMVQGFAYDYIFTMHMVSEEESHESESGITTTNSHMCSTTLSYLNSSSSRRRISYFVLTLKDAATPDFDPVDALMTLAQDTKQERLVRIIKDVLS
ncbi:hypothetical protein FSP39_002616 [Pinctada imbricata]|uniref:Protein saal1 n=1 Tax=Pinctada imbricata TaxID=66713 RepID=A0AA89C9Q6_PINIB|nr:hypothetical protein FSP39_002616 [Pinctada imbricata]